MAAISDSRERIFANEDTPTTPSVGAGEATCGGYAF